MSLIRHYIDKFSQITLSTNLVSFRCIFDITTYLHDSMDIYNTSGNKNISELIISFISRVDFGMNVEQQLNLYIDCRSSFVNLEEVQYRLIYLVTRLGYNSVSKLKSNYHRGYNNLKSCLSFASVTIEGLYNPIHKLYYIIIIFRKSYSNVIQLSLQYNVIYIYLVYKLYTNVYFILYKYTKLSS